MGTEEAAICDARRGERESGEGVGSEAERRRRTKKNNVFGARVRKSKKHFLRASLAPALCRLVRVMPASPILHRRKSLMGERSTRAFLRRSRLDCSLMACAPALRLGNLRLRKGNVAVMVSMLIIAAVILRGVLHSSRSPAFGIPLEPLPVFHDEKILHFHNHPVSKHRPVS